MAGRACPSRAMERRGLPAAFGSGKGLHLGQDGARALRRGEDDGTRPVDLASLRARKSADGSRRRAAVRPSSPISNTPISSVGPKRFFTEPENAVLVAAFALEIEDGVDHGVRARADLRSGRPS